MLTFFVVVVDFVLLKGTTLYLGEEESTPTKGLRGFYICLENEKKKLKGRE